MCSAFRRLRGVFFLILLFLIRIRKIIREIILLQKYYAVGRQPAETILSARWEPKHVCRLSAVRCACAWARPQSGAHTFGRLLAERFLSAVSLPKHGCRRQPQAPLLPSSSLLPPLFFLLALSFPLEKQGSQPQLIFKNSR